MSVGISLFAGVGQQFFDNSGIPLAGGLIYTYEAGTSTPATTYTSSSGATPHANPIVLNAAGRVTSGEIWLTTTTVYKFVLKTSAGVTIATYDNVGAVPSVDGLLLSTNNLSDLTNVATARTNLGLGTAAVEAATAFATSGANSNITSITGLITPLAQSQGGTGTTGGVTSKIQPITATQAAGAITFTLNATTLDFRSTTLPSGAVTTISNTALTLVLPSGGTLGSPTTVSQRLILVAINNAGTAELAIVNLAGGNNLTETGVINTVAIDTASDANNVFYSTTARSGVAYRVVGAIDCINTAGAWGTPTLVQGVGGQALAAMSSLGYGQTWQDVTGNRALATTYYNTTGKPITVAVRSAGASAQDLVVDLQKVSAWAPPAGFFTSGIGIVPIGSSYNVIGNSFTSWFELR